MAVRHPKPPKPGDDEIVRLEVKLPRELKNKAQQMANREHEGKLGHFLRDMIRKKWASLGTDGES